MELLIILPMITQHSIKGAELIQYCREERAEVLATTGDIDYAHSVYLKCLNNG